MFAGELALAIAAVFTGAAFYAGFVEQPARLELDNRGLLVEWKPAYKRGFVMQAPLAIVGFLLGVIAWWLSERAAFLIGAVLLRHGLRSPSCPSIECLWGQHWTQQEPKADCLFLNGTGCIPFGRYS